MSPLTKNTYWLGVSTSTKYFLVSTSSHFASSFLELSFLSQRVALGNFSDYSSLVLLCGSVSLSRVLLRFCFCFNSFSFFLLSCHFLFHRRELYSCGGFTLHGNDFLAFLSIFDGVQKCCKSADPRPEVDIGTALEEIKVSRESAEKVDKRIVAVQTKSHINGTNI